MCQEDVQCQSHFCDQQGQEWLTEDLLPELSAGMTLVSGDLILFLLQLSDESTGQPWTVHLPAAVVRPPPKDDSTMPLQKRKIGGHPTECRCQHF